MHFIIVGLVLACAQPFTAPPLAAQTPQADPATIAAADALLVSTGFDQQLEQSAITGVTTMMDAMTSQAEKERGQTMPADLKASIRTIMLDGAHEAVVRMKPTARRDAALVYARYFTAAELIDLRRLQAEPVMAKAQKIMPVMMGELMQIGLRSSMQGLPDVRAKIVAAVEAWGKTQRKR